MTKTELTTLALASALHVALLVVAERTPGQNLLFDRGGGDEAWIDVTMEDPPERLAVAATDSTTTRPEEADEPRDATPERRREAGATTPRAAGPSAGAAEGPDEGATGEAPAAGAGEEGAAALPPPGSPDEYGPPEAPAPRFGVGPALWTLPGGLSLVGPAAPTEAPRARELDAEAPAKIVASTLRDRDRALGVTLPGATVVVSAVSTATRAVAVPHNTRATFEVKLGPGGRVLSSKVVKASGGDKSAWDAAAKSVAASLAGKKLDIGDAKTATVLVSVTTKHVFPAGTAKAADVKPVCANQILNDLADGLDKQPDKNPDAVVPLLQDENGRPCIPIGVAGISDAANLGAQKQIQVQTASQVLIDGEQALPAKVQAVNKDPFWLDRGTGAPRPVMPHKARKYKRDKEKKK